MNCLYVLKINSLLVASFANTFSHSVGCLFILFMGSFDIQHSKSLIRSHLFIFAFVFISLGDGSKKTLHDLCQSVLMFSTRSFTVSSPTFTSLSQFELIFVCGVREFLILFLLL